MPNREINLFRKHEVFTADELKLKSFTKRVLPLILGFYILLLALSLFASVAVNQQLASADSAIVKERAAIAELKGNEGTYLLLKQKASVLGKILDSRFAYAEKIEFFKSLEITGAAVESLEVDETGKLVVSLKVLDSNHLERLVTMLVKEAEKRFTKVEVEGVSYIPGNSILQITLSIETIENILQ